MPLFDFRRAIVRLRKGLANDAELSCAIAKYRKCSEAEAIATELLPLAETCRWLQRNTKKILGPSTLSRSGRPIWLCDTTIRRHFQPRGTVLVIGPSNYPLFLTAAPALHALAAGNTVRIKPSPGASALIESFRSAALSSGFPDDSIQCTDDSVDAVYEQLNSGVNLVVFTGSSANGRQILEACARQLIPAIVELSGCDSVHVLEDANVELAAKCVAYALTLNAGQTCLSPRRLILRAPVADSFRERLSMALETFPAARPLYPPQTLTAIVDDALQSGASAIVGDPKRPENGPIVFDNIPTRSRLWNSDTFFPITGIHVVESDDQAIAADCACPYQLGASVYSRQRGHRFAQRLPAPTVTVNDTVVATADPRLPFGGRGESGWGRTRGAEGLRQMCVEQHIVIRRSPFRPNLVSSMANDADALRNLLRVLHR